MNKKTTKTALASFSTSSYESPTMTVVDIHSEGILCASGELEDWFEGELDW